jgi:hypothetical protein
MNPYIDTSFSVKDESEGELEAAVIYTNSTNAVFVISRTRLALMFIYCR